MRQSLVITEVFSIAIVMTQDLTTMELRGLMAVLRSRRSKREGIRIKEALRGLGERKRV